MLRYLKIANDLNLCSLAQTANIFMWWMLHTKKYGKYVSKGKKKRYLLGQQMQTST